MRSPTTLASANRGSATWAIEGTPDLFRGPQRHPTRYVARPPAQVGKPLSRAQSVWRLSCLVAEPFGSWPRARTDDYQQRSGCSSPVLPQLCTDQCPAPRGRYSQAGGTARNDPAIPRALQEGYARSSTGLPCRAYAKHARTPRRSVRAHSGLPMLDSPATAGCDARTEKSVRSVSPGQDHHQSKQADEEVFQGQMLCELPGEEMPERLHKHVKSDCERCSERHR